jgi:hypothetical protein
LVDYFSCLPLLSYLEYQKNYATIDRSPPSAEVVVAVGRRPSQETGWGRSVPSIILLCTNTNHNDDDDDDDGQWSPLSVVAAVVVVVSWWSFPP